MLDLIKDQERKVSIFDVIKMSEKSFNICHRQGHSLQAGV